MFTTSYLFQIIQVFVIAFGVAFLMTPVSIKLAHKFDIIDRPRDDRRVHDRPIPRFGGLAIFAGTMVAWIIPAQVSQDLKAAMLGGALMYLLGIVDDIKNLKPAAKFIGQTAIASLMFAMGIRISFISDYFGTDTTGLNAHVVLSDGIAFILTVLWIVGITNAVNLMDGMDGLAAGSVAIMTLSLAYIAYIHGARLGSLTVGLALVAVAGGCLGFLPFNFSPAKTFMGDGGALFLGFMVSVLSVISPLKRATFVAAIVPMLTLAVPIFDTLVAMLRRKIRHESIMKADKEHLHHHLLSAGFGQRRSVLIMYGIVAIMGEVSVLISRELYKDALFLAIVAFLYLIIIIIPKTPTERKKLKKGITRIKSDEENK